MSASNSPSLESHKSHSSKTPASALWRSASRALRNASGVPRLSILGQAFSRALPGAYEPPVQVAIKSHYVGSFHLPWRKDEAVSRELLSGSLVSQEPLLRQRKSVFLFHEYRAERPQ